MAKELATRIVRVGETWFHSHIVAVTSKHVPVVPLGSQNRLVLGESSLSIRGAQSKGLVSVNLQRFLG